MRLLRSLGFVLLALSAPLAAQTRVLVVDALGGAGSEYRSLNAAVDAAADGDILLVRPAAYDEIVTLEGKALSLLGAGGARRPSVRGLLVRGSAAGSSTTVRGLDVRLDGAVPVHVEDCAGQIWLEDVRLERDPSSTYASGALITDSDAVVLTSCVVTGLRGWGLPGLSVVRSTVQVFHASLAGCDSNDELFSHGFQGGPALRVEDGRVLVAGGTLAGGAGGSILSPICSLRGGEGGTALHVSGVSRVELQGSTLAGGPGGTSCGTDGQPGPRMIVAGGEVIEAPLLARECRLEPLGSMGRSTTALLRGRPGELALFLCSPRPAVASSSALFRGRLLLGEPLRVLQAAFVPASGDLLLPLEIPRFLGPQLLRFHAQGLFLDPEAGLVLSNPSSLTVLGWHQLPAGPP